MGTNTANSSHEPRVAKLPAKVPEILKGCPREGNGVHSWLFRTALSLQSHFSESEIVEILRANLSCDRPEREIADAVENSGRVARGEMPSGSQIRWPAVDYTMVHKTVVNSPVRLKDLRSLSPMDLSTDRTMTEEILDTIFPGDPLLCLGREVNACWTRSREFWRGRESTFQFVVANPMTKEKGMKKDGKESQRCLDNTGPRNYLPIEFDISEVGAWAPYVADWRSKRITVDDANVALLLELSTRGLPRFPLALAVHSGGKSVHSWFPCVGFTDEQIRPFMERAVRLGADKATWTRCQLVRMPDGTRDNGNRQRVHYFNPELVRVEGGVK
jgi:hypothetical protein